MSKYLSWWATHGWALWYAVALGTIAVWHRSLPLFTFAWTRPFMAAGATAAALLACWPNRWRIREGAVVAVTFAAFWRAATYGLAPGIATFDRIAGAAVWLTIATSFVTIAALTSRGRDGR